jgi:hypothetical protein
MFIVVNGLPMLTSRLMGTLAALSLNLLVRIGVTETERLTCRPV